VTTLNGLRRDEDYEVLGHLTYGIGVEERQMAILFITAAQTDSMSGRVALDSAKKLVLHAHSRPGLRPLLAPRAAGLMVDDVSSTAEKAHRCDKPTKNRGFSP
jgi:hypothetical protein